MREERNRGGPCKNHGLGRGILRVRVQVRTRGNWLVEHSEAGAYRCLMIRERIPGQADTAIPIERVRVRPENVMYQRKSWRRQRIEDRVARLGYANRVGLKVVP